MPWATTKAIAETRRFYCHSDVPINVTSRITVLPALLITHALRWAAISSIGGGGCCFSPFVSMDVSTFIMIWIEQSYVSSFALGFYIFIPIWTYYFVIHVLFYTYECMHIDNWESAPFYIYHYSEKVIWGHVSDSPCFHSYLVHYTFQWEHTVCGW